MRSRALLRPTGRQQEFEPILGPNLMIFGEIGCKFERGPLWMELQVW